MLHAGLRRELHCVLCCNALFAAVRTRFCIVHTSAPHTALHAALHSALHSARHSALHTALHTVLHRSAHCAAHRSAHFAAHRSTHCTAHRTTLCTTLHCDTCCATLHTVPLNLLFRAERYTVQCTVHCTAPCPFRGPKHSVSVSRGFRGHHARAGWDRKGAC